MPGGSVSWGAWGEGSDGRGSGAPYALKLSTNRQAAAAPDSTPPDWTNGFPHIISQSNASPPPSPLRQRASHGGDIAGIAGGAGKRRGQDAYSTHQPRFSQHNGPPSPSKVGSDKENLGERGKRAWGSPRHEGSEGGGGRGGVSRAGGPRHEGSEWHREPHAQAAAGRLRCCPPWPPSTPLQCLQCCPPCPPVIPAIPPRQVASCLFKRTCLICP